MAAQANLPLREGAQLENYRIVRVLASGGFSFVYLAHDEKGAPVAIKEYLPATLKLRIDDTMRPHVPATELERYRFGIRCFFEEGRALAGLEHPNVVRVLNFFRANETVYLVMRYERGRSLAEHIKQSRKSALEELWFRTTFAQLLDGLREVHTHKLLHLDIKPGNVYLRNDGSPILIDFGGARQTLSDEGLKLPPTYTPGFASPEHHHDHKLLGPWSDIYSIGATMYSCLAGAAPQNAPARLQKDLFAPASLTWAGKFPEDLLAIIDWCLRLDHLERPQSVFALQKALLGEKPPERHHPKAA